MKTKKLVKIFNGYFDGNFNGFFAAFFNTLLPNTLKKLLKKSKGKSHYDDKISQTFSFQRHIFVNTCAIALILT